MSDIWFTYTKIYYLISETISPNLKLEWIQDWVEEQEWNGFINYLSSINKKNIFYQGKS